MSDNAQPIGGSFRDPAGRVFFREGAILRAVYPSGAADYEFRMDYPMILSGGIAYTGFDRLLLAPSPRRAEAYYHEVKSFTKKTREYTSQKENNWSHRTKYELQMSTVRLRNKPTKVVRRPARAWRTLLSLSWYTNMRAAVHLTLSRGSASRFGGSPSLITRASLKEKNGWPPDRPDTPKVSVVQAGGRTNAGHGLRRSVG